MEIITDIDGLLVDKDKSGLYTAIINNKKAIRNSQLGFWIYFYEVNPQSFENHKEFDYYHLKIKRSEQIIEKILQLNLPERLTKGINQLAQFTEELTSNGNQKRIDINIYKQHVTKLIMEMIPNELNLYDELKLHTSDLVRNLPKLSKPIITEAYFIPNKNKKPINENCPDLPFEMSKSIIGNNFIFPIEVNEDGVEIWYGHSMGSKIGSGFKEIWKKINNKWECIHWNSTWIS